MGISAVMFDFGGVFSHSPFGAVEAYGRAIGAKPGQVTQILFGNYGADEDHPWHRLERGEATLGETEEAIKRLGAQQGLEIGLAEAFSHFPRGGGVNQELVDYVGELKERGYLLSIVTNNVREFSDGWRKLIPVDELFDDVVDSSAVGMRKPELGIYKLALRQLGIKNSQEAIFLDDFEPNVSAAQSLGIHGIHVTEDKSLAIAQLRALLENSPRQ